MADEDGERCLGVAASLLSIDLACPWVGAARRAGEANSDFALSRAGWTMTVTVTGGLRCVPPHASGNGTPSDFREFNLFAGNDSRRRRWRFATLWCWCWSVRAVAERGQFLCWLACEAAPRTLQLGRLAGLHHQCGLVSNQIVGRPGPTSCEGCRVEWAGESSSVANPMRWVHLRRRPGERDGSSSVARAVICRKYRRWVSASGLPRHTPRRGR